MVNREKMWVEKSDEELLRLSTMMLELTAEGKEELIAELERRGIECPYEEEQKTEAIDNRYSDAYIVANTITNTGAFFKFLGVCIGIILIVVAVFNDMGMLLIIPAVFLGFLLWAIGVIVSAQGQMLKASVDTAVNTSPFISTANKARIMSVSYQD